MIIAIYVEKSAWDEVIISFQQPIKIFTDLGTFLYSSFMDLSSFLNV